MQHAACGPVSAVIIANFAAMCIGRYSLTIVPPPAQIPQEIFQDMLSSDSDHCGGGGSAGRKAGKVGCIKYKSGSKIPDIRNQGFTRVKVEITLSFWLFVVLHMQLDTLFLVESALILSNLHLSRFISEI